MKHAVIDIGSNSMRLTIYELDGSRFRILFKEKVMAGLAGYVDDGALTEAGISRACDGLMTFREILELFQLPNPSVFATASLRNITNTEAAVAEICAATGYVVEILSGAEEAQYSYFGAMYDLSMSDGMLTDVGGASTELAFFSNGRLESASSFPIGSLKLYRECVKGILPGSGSLKRLNTAITAALSKAPDVKAAGGVLACVGGTARAALKLSETLFELSEGENSISSKQLCELCGTLEEGGKKAADLILKTEPERIHTIVPGLMVLKHLVKKYDVSRLVVSRYGVREGYLCQRIQSKM